MLLAAVLSAQGAPAAFAAGSADTAYYTFSAAGEKQYLTGEMDDG